jgi:alpha-glucoside transport system permease protein
VLALYIVYPLAFSFGRSLFDGSGENFVGLDNYVNALTDGRTSVALKNNLIWVLVAPTLVTAFGLLFAVLTERIMWSAAFRLVLFMPMAISLFASGVIFRLVYDQDPDLGVANAATVTVHDMFTESSDYPGARPREADLFTDSDAAGRLDALDAAFGAAGISSQYVVAEPGSIGITNNGCNIQCNTIISIGRLDQFAANNRAIIIGMSTRQHRGNSGN